MLVIRFISTTAQKNKQNAKTLFIASKGAEAASNDDDVIGCHGRHQEIFQGETQFLIWVEIEKKYTPFLRTDLKKK